MRLFAVGLSHRTAPVELRECVDFARRGLDAALAALAARNADARSGRASTCNRAEIYAVADSRRGRRVLRRFISEYNGVPWDALAPHVVIYRGARGRRPPVPRRRRPRLAGRRRAADPRPGQGRLRDGDRAEVHRRADQPAVHSAFSVGKRVRTRDRPRRRRGLGQLRGDRAGEEDLRRPQGPERADPRRRRDGQAHRRAPAGAARQADHDREPHARDAPKRSPRSSTAAPCRGRRSDEALARADIVVTATGATEPVLTRARVEEAMRPRRSRPLFIIDIAVPRDVEPAVGDLDQVFLYNIDDLQAIVKENLARRTPRSSAPRRSSARKWTGSARGCSRARSSRRSSRCAQRFEAIRQAELQRLEPKLAPLPPEARARVDEITHLIVEKLLLTPTEQLKATRRRGARRRVRGRAEPAVRAATAPKRDDEPAKRSVTARCGSARAAARWRCGRRGPSPACSRRSGRDDRARHRSRRRRSAPGRAAVRGRRQAAVRQGDRGRAARAATSTSRCTARRTCRSRCPTGSAIAAVLPREDPRDALVLRARASTALGRRRRDRHQQRPPHRAARARHAAARGSCRFAATWTRGCASWTPASTTRWCSPPPA